MTDQFQHKVHYWLGLIYRDIYIYMHFSVYLFYNHYYALLLLATTLKNSASGKQSKHKLSYGITQKEQNQNTMIAVTFDKR